MYDRLARTVFLVLELCMRCSARPVAGFRENGGVWGRVPPCLAGTWVGGDPLLEKKKREGRGDHPPPLVRVWAVVRPGYDDGGCRPIPP